VCRFVVGVFVCVLADVAGENNFWVHSFLVFLLCKSPQFARLA